MVTLFDPNSMRAKKARLGAWLGSGMITAMVVLALLLLFGGGALVALGSSWGWLAAGLSVLPAMVVEWYNGELKRLAPGSDTSRIDSLLDGELLGRLPMNPSPHELADAVGDVTGGRFLAARFGVSAGMLASLVSSETAGTEVVWREALNLHKRLGGETISAGVLLMALLHTVPRADTLLAHLQLDDADLGAGVQWYDSLTAHINAPRPRRKTGGVARDWSFGWIPTLERFGQNISQGLGSATVEVITHADVLDQLVRAFASDGRRSVALVGPDGVGKTQLLYAFASRLLDGDAPAAVRFRQVFLLDAASIVSAASARGSAEDLVNQLLGEAYAAKNIIVCLENAHLFFENGLGSIDLTNLLLPILEAGRLPILLTMDEQRALEISKRTPALGNALTRLAVKPASPVETLLILQDQLPSLEFQYHVVYMYQALKEALRLSDRYVNDLAQPGAALKVLELAAQQASDGLVTAESVQKAVEASTGVKVGNARKSAERDTLLKLEQLIHQRMIGQTHAVQVVSDAIRRARAGVRNQDRPIGTFLFLGPTGVGKTELAKSLAAVYFGGEDHMIRLDMNEYVAAADVARLTASPTTDSMSLTAQITKQPFSVVLLDEIEKAHSSVLTALLQVLDEGVLKDENNHDVSFRDAIIIATSNAGAERIREFVARGQDLSKFEDQLIDELISGGQFKPEFLNRFDEIVVFSPLSTDELLQVVDLIITSVNKTLAAQKITVQVDDDAKKYLVEAGYDPRLGARPMRRVVQKAVENTVAKQLLAGEVEAGGTVKITRDQVQALLDNKKQADEIVEGAK